MYKSDKAAVLFRIAGEPSAAAISCLGDASVSSSMDVDSRNCIGSSVPEKTAMSMDWSVSFSGVADLSEDGVQERLFAAYKAGKKIQIAIIYRDEPVVDGYEGTVILSDWSVSMSAPGIAEVSFTGQGASELFLVHENSLGVAVTIITATGELAKGEAVKVKATPAGGTVVFELSKVAEGVTIDANTGVVTYAASVTNNTTFSVKATLTSGTDTAEATQEFKVVGQAS